MKTENSIRTLSLSNPDPRDRQPFNFTEYPGYGQVNTRRYGPRCPRTYVVENADFTRAGVFVDGTLLVESCLLGQYQDSITNGVGDQYVHNIFADLPSLNRDLNIIDKAFYCVNAWDANYQHFIIETLPKIFLAMQIGGAPIYVSGIGFIRDIIDAIAPRERVVYIDKWDTIYSCKNLYIIPPVAQNFDPLTEIQIMAIRYLRNSVIYKSCGDDSPRHQMAFIGRINTDGISGFNRRIVNSKLVNETLNDLLVPIHDFNGLSLTEKCKLASLYKKQITPIGANLMNFIFCSAPVDLRVIDHVYFKSHQFFENLFSKVGAPVNYRVLSIAEPGDGEDDWPSNPNSPYKINITRFRDELLDAMR